MPRAGTPTDNAAMESINGWLKAEMFIDFHLTSKEKMIEEIDEYIQFFNERRPAYSLKYMTPKQDKEVYYKKTRAESMKCCVYFLLTSANSMINNFVSKIFRLSKR